MRGSLLELKGHFMRYTQKVFLENFWSCDAPTSVCLMVGRDVVASMSVAEVWSEESLPDEYRKREKKKVNLELAG